MSMSPMPSSTRPKPAWSTPCSTAWRGMHGPGSLGAHDLRRDLGHMSLRLPPPLWGRVGVGVGELWQCRATSLDPHPRPLPTRGGGGSSKDRLVFVASPSLQLVRVDPVLILRIDLDLRHRLELALIERRHVGLGRAEGGEMRFRPDEPPVIRIRRPVAPSGPVGLGGGVDRGRPVAFYNLYFRQHVVGIGLTEGVGAAFGSLPNVVEPCFGFNRLAALKLKSRDRDECREF